DQVRMVVPLDPLGIADELARRGSVYERELPPDPRQVRHHETDRVGLMELVTAVPRLALTVDTSHGESGFLIAASGTALAAAQVQPARPTHGSPAPGCCPLGRGTPESLAPIAPGMPSRSAPGYARTRGPG